MTYYPIVIGGGPAGEKSAAQAAYFGKRIHSPTAGGVRVLRRACDALASAIDRTLTAAFVLVTLTLVGSLVAMAAGLLLPSPTRDGSVADVLVTAANGAPLLVDNGGPARPIALLDSPDNAALDSIPLVEGTHLDDGPALFDQRGVSRPQPADGKRDIGGFQLIREAPVTIAVVIDLFDQAVGAGTLMGVGPGGSPVGRLEALRNMLLTAGALLEQGDVDAAWSQLQDAADRIDGASPRPDFVQGRAAPDLLDAITEVKASIPPAQG